MQESGRPLDKLPPLQRRRALFKIKQHNIRRSSVPGEDVVAVSPRGEHRVQIPWQQQAQNSGTPPFGLAVKDYGTLTLELPPLKRRRAELSKRAILSFGVEPARAAAAESSNDDITHLPPQSPPEDDGSAQHRTKPSRPSRPAKPSDHSGVSSARDFAPTQLDRRGRLCSHDSSQVTGARPKGRRAEPPLQRDTGRSTLHVQQHDLRSEQSHIVSEFYKMSTQGAPGSAAGSQDLNPHRRSKPARVMNPGRDATLLCASGSSRQPTTSGVRASRPKPDMTKPVNQYYLKQELTHLEEYFSVRYGSEWVLPGTTSNLKNRVATPILLVTRLLQARAEIREAVLASLGLPNI